MIDIRKLKELIRLMVANELSEIDLRDETEQVTIKRPGDGGQPQVIMPQAPVQQVAAPAVAPAASPAAPAAVAEAPAAEAAPPAGHHIESPMVGTFYSASSPDKPAFVKAGDTVTPDTIVCLIEAMKIFNEIKAECSGTIEKVMVSNGEAVEFGQPLFIVKTD